VQKLSVAQNSKNTSCTLFFCSMFLFIPSTCLYSFSFFSFLFFFREVLNEKFDVVTSGRGEKEKSNDNSFAIITTAHRRESLHSKFIVNPFQQQRQQQHSRDGVCRLDSKMP
jgi:hypothetical protein